MYDSSNCFFFFKKKTAYEVRISDWSSDVCSSDLPLLLSPIARAGLQGIEEERHRAACIDPIVDAGHAFVDAPIGTGAEVDDAKQQLAAARRQLLRIGEAFEQALQRRGVIDRILAEEATADAQRPLLVDRALALEPEPPAGQGIGRGT